jgi:hypothetical protein
MEGKKRDRPLFFNQVFRKIIDDYKNNIDKPNLTVNVLKAFKQLEAAEVDPSLLSYSIILNKDPDDYQPYTPQHKIGKSLNNEPGSLIKYYKTGQQQDGYKGYSINYHDLDIDVYKVELWKLIKDILRLLDCAIQKLEDQIFLTTIEDDNNDNNEYVTLFGTIYTSRVNKRNDINNYDKNPNNIQRNESLDKYRSLCLVLKLA